MINFKTITELEILDYARYGVIEHLLRDRKHLAENPNDEIAKRQIPLWEGQFREIDGRILDLEKADQRDNRREN